MKEFLKVSELEVGDTIDSSVGYVFTITKIEKLELKFSTPKYELTGYSNIDDSKKEYTKTMFGNSIALVISKNFEYEPKIKL